MGACDKITVRDLATQLVAAERPLGRCGAQRAVHSTADQEVGRYPRAPELRAVI